MPLPAPFTPLAGLPTMVPVTTHWLPVVVAALLAATLVHLYALRRASPTPRLRRLGQGAGFCPFGPELPGTGDGHSIWIGPPAFGELLATRLAARGPVLLLGPAPSLARTTLAVWALEAERPSARAVLQAAAHLAREGAPPTLVVAGADRMERPADGRPTAALEELLAASPYAVFLVLEEGAPRPAGPWRVVAAADAR